MNEENREHHDTEATDKEFKGVCYTGICLAALVAVAIGSLIFALVS